MDAFVEPRVRRIVADVLGVEPEFVMSGVSLADDLAADSLDLAELASALEADFGVPIAHGFPGWVRTCGQLVTFIDERRPRTPPRLWVTLSPPGTPFPPLLTRSEWLTPYGLETIAQDALRCATGTTLDVAVDPFDEGYVDTIREALSRLDGRGIQVSIHPPGERPRPARIDAA
jgi:acyl carrier protein